MMGKRERDETGGITADNVFCHLRDLISELPDSVADQVFTVITGPFLEDGFDLGRGPLHSLHDDPMIIAGHSVYDRSKKRYRLDMANPSLVRYSFLSDPVLLGITPEQKVILNKIKAVISNDLLLPLTVERECNKTQGDGTTMGINTIIKALIKYHDASASAPAPAGDGEGWESDQGCAPP